MYHVSFLAHGTTPSLLPISAQYSQVAWQDYVGYQRGLLIVHLRVPRRERLNSVQWRSYDFASIPPIEIDMR